MGLLVWLKKPTCFKNPDKPTCIDIILINEPNSFQYSNVFETGFSDLHFLTVTKFKMGSKKLPPKKVNYWDYKNFGNEKFSSDISKFDFGASDLEGFKITIFCIFKKHAPIKANISLCKWSSIYGKWTAQSHYEKNQTKK